MPLFEYFWPKRPLPTQIDPETGQATAAQEAVDATRLLKIGIGIIGGEHKPLEETIGLERLDNAYKRIRKELLSGQREPSELDYWVTQNWRRYAGPSEDDPELKDDLYRFGIELLNF